MLEHPLFPAHPLFRVQVLEVEAAEGLLSEEVVAEAVGQRRPEALFVE